MEHNRAQPGTAWRSTMFSFTEQAICFSHHLGASWGFQSGYLGSHPDNLVHTVLGLPHSMALGVNQHFRKMGSMGQKCISSLCLHHACCVPWPTVTHMVKPRVGRRVRNLGAWLTGALKSVCHTVWMQKAAEGMRGAPKWHQEVFAGGSD